MKGEYVLTFRWAPRRENSDECACRMDRYVRGLAQVSPAFTSWRRNKPREKIFKAPIPVEKLQEWMLDGVNRGDADGLPIERLGFSLGMTVSGNGKKVQTRVNCGVFSEVMVNNGSIEFYWHGPIDPEFLDLSILRRIFDVVVTSWEPDIVLMTTVECLLLKPPLHHAGWLTYLSPVYDGFNDIPEPGRVEKLGNGRLIVACQEAFSFETPEHLAYVKELSQEIKAYRE